MTVCTPTDPELAMNAAPALTPADRFRLAPMASPADFFAPPVGIDILTLPHQINAQYQVGFAVSPMAVDRALRLRYAVFNEELGEGLMASRTTGLDRDEFDDQMRHLVLFDAKTHEVVGTYRLQTATHGLAGLGLYCANEYDLSPIMHLVPQLVECGRACVLKGHRSYSTVMMLWKGLAVFMDLTNCRYLFGCCSLTTIDPDDGWRAMRALRKMGVLEKDLMAPMPATSCGDPARETSGEVHGTVKIPKLFGAYLSLGSRVISFPAIDREFGTVDFLIMLDKTRVNFSSLLIRA